MGRCEVKRNLKGPRRLGWGAVLTFVSGILGCGGGDNNPVSPEPPADEGQPPVAGCSGGVLEHGALYQICFPGSWNGDLVLYAHGYVRPGSELALPNDQVGGQNVSTTVTSLGYAYATTSYRANGLVAPQATEDLVELEATVRRLYRPDPDRSVVVGVSEGGLVATLAAERHPERFAGALAACGPVGSFRKQLDYFDDFRVVFDYLFPGVIPGSPVQVPDSVVTRWENVYAPAVAVALLTRPAAARELIRITGAPVARDDIAAIVETALGILWYNVVGSADAQGRLGGQPFDNTTRVYTGSSDDAALNAGVARFAADPAAIAGLAEFETSGNLVVPVVTLHTTGDPIVPFEQEALYAAKVSQSGASTRLSQTPVDRYGHCAFQAGELLGAFSTLIEKVAPPVAATAFLSNTR
jgi:pimeloyl-ACP methyl ester carboxylesterase